MQRILAPVEYRAWRIAEIVARIDRSAGDNACWPWRGAHDRQGYGFLTFEGRRWQATRFFFTLTIGPIPKELDLLHRCDNPPCCNPAHLWPGTAKENIRDSITKGRWVVGDHTGGANGRCKLTDDDVRAIRQAYDNGATQRSLTALYDLGPSQVGRIVRREQWRHL